MQQKRKNRVNMRQRTDYLSDSSQGVVHAVMQFRTDKVLLSEGVGLLFPQDEDRTKTAGFALLRAM